MKFFTSLLSVSLLLLIGRFSGFVREWLIARFGGAGQDTDIAIVLISLPDLMVSLLLGGGFAAAVVPALQKRTPDEASRLFLQITGLCAIVFCGIALLVASVPTLVLNLLSPGLPDSAIRAAIPLFLVTTLAIPLSAISGVNQAKLVSHERFWSSQAGTFIFNLSIIAAILIAGGYAFLPAIAVGIFAGASFRVLAQIPDLRRTWTPATRTRVPVEPGLFSSLVVTTFFAGTMALLLVIGRAFASGDGPGGLSLFSYAYRITELPIALVYAPLATVFLPRISAAYRDAMRGQVSREIALVLRFSLLLGTAMIVPVVFFARDFIMLIFSATPLTSPQIDTLTAVLIIAIAFLPLRGLVVLSLPILSATENTRRLVPIAAAAIVTIFAVCAVAAPAWGVAGAMLGYGVAHLVAAGLVVLVLYRQIGGDILSSALQAALRCGAVPLAVATVICWGGAHWTDGGGAALATSALAFAVFSALLVVADPDARALARRILGRKRTEA